MDDRARPAPLLSPADLQRAGADPDPRRAALARHLESAIRSEYRRFTLRGFALTIALLIAWLALWGVVQVSGLSRTPGVGIVVFWGGLLLISLAARTDARRRIAAELAATAVAEGICGVCCYSLEALPLEPDGCVVCPECGAAWRHARVTRPHWVYAAGSLHRRLSRFRRFLTLTPSGADLLAPDARGRFVPILDSRLVLLPESRRAALGSDRRARLRRRLRCLGRVRRVLLAAAPAFVIVLLSREIAGALDRGRPDQAAIMAIPVVFLGILCAAVLLGHGFLSPRRAARILVADGLCASCARDLAGLPPADDGLVVCPDCGAAWATRPAG